MFTNGVSKRKTIWTVKGEAQTCHDSSNPEVIAQEIVDDLEAVIEQFRLITNDLGKETP